MLSALLSMPYGLRKVKVGYEVNKISPVMNNLLFMDYLKLFGLNEKQLKTSMNTVRIVSIMNVEL